MPKYALTGVSVASVGAQWRIGPSDKDIAVQLIDELENRRILWELTVRETSDRCAASASYMREFIGGLMRTLGIGSELKTELKTMQRHFRRFMSDLSDYKLDRPGLVDAESLERVLGWLRQPVGEQVGLLAAQYSIEVSDDLASIVPDQTQWFYKAAVG